MDEPSLVSLPTSKWRVKLYKLINSQWTDTGTGTCWGELVNNAPFLVVEDEDDPTRELLRSAVGVHQTTYQKQDTLIIWTETLDGAQAELALSFQEVTGSIIVCEFLVYARSYLGAEIDVLTQQNNETEALVECATLPPLPTATNLRLVLQRLSDGCKSGYVRDSISVWFIQSEYLSAMAALFEQLESPRGSSGGAVGGASTGAPGASETPNASHDASNDDTTPKDDSPETPPPQEGADNSKPATPALSPSERLEALHDLCEVAKALFNMGENLFIDMLLEDSLFSSFLGMFEYDREFGKRKANYRRYFAEGFTYKEILPIEDPAIVEKIRKTFRLQLLKDVVLARLLDDTLFGVLTSLILVSYMEIISWLQTNSDFMTKIFALYEPAGASDVKDDGVVFLTHILSQSKVFAQQRGPLYVSLVDHGLLNALAYGLMRPSRELKSASLECIRLLLDSDINVIESSKPVMCALLDLCKHSEPGFRGLQLQACETLKGMLEPPTNPQFEKTFYESCADEVFAELTSPTLRLDYDPDVLVDFLGYCLRHHRASSDRLLSGLGLWNVVANLLVSPQLSRSALLSCVRCLKYMVVGCTDNDVCKLLESDALGNALDLLEKIGNINTLLHSALLDLLVACNEPTKALLIREWIMDHKPHLRGSTYPPLVELLRNTKRPSETVDLREAHVAQRFKPDDAAAPGPGTPRPKKPLKRGFQAAGQSDAPRDALVSFKE